MRLGCAFLFCLFTLTFTSPAQQIISLSDSPAGQKVTAYIKAFNSGDTTVMREYILHQYSETMLHDVPMSQRLERYQQFFAMTQGLTLQKVLTLREEYIKTIVQAGDGKILAMIFEFDERMPHGIIGINIDEDTGESTVKPVKNDAELITNTMEYVDKMASTDDFSGVVLIAKNGEPLFMNAWGFADKENNMPNTTDTKFNIGSMDKSFTAFAIHKLAAQGKLKFTDPIKTFLPEYPNGEAARKVTIKHLLEMTSGIGDFFGERFMTARKENIKRLKDYLPLFADKQLEFEPGVRTRYSNGGYIVLGMIIEHITSTDYYEYIKKELFNPAGMTKTDWFERTMLPVNCAVGYTNTMETGRDSVRHRNTEFLPQKGSSAGGGYSTAHDLLLYVKALQSSTFTPKSFGAQNGMGIAGGTAGVNAALEWDKRSGYVIIVLSNYDPPVAEKISRQVRMLLGI